MSGIIEAVAGKLAQALIPPYTARLQKSGLIPVFPKEINDPIWGTIALTPLEIAVLDSPLVQRLRHLKQLGVVHWLYPGAVHSRFEHTLGVLHQTEQLIIAINRSSLIRCGKEIIASSTRDVLRLSAVMHDIGHPVLSHVSEYALKLEPAMLLGVQKTLSGLGEHVKLSEIIAALVVKSDEFKKLLRTILAKHVEKELPSAHWAERTDALVDQISKCILGQNISNEIPLLHELISGPFDADKLDYMVRDAKAAGIPSILDISRLIQKITVRSLAQPQLPRRIAKQVRGGLPNYYLFGFMWSGLSVVDELLLARMILYAKVYRHPKVVAAEAMVNALVEQISMLVSPQELVEFIYDLLDDELVLITKPYLLERLGLREAELADPRKAKAMDAACEIIRRLRDRDLFVRSFAIYPYDPHTDSDDDDDYPFARLAKLLSDRKEAENLRQDIISETKKIIEILVPNYQDDEGYQHADTMVLVQKAAYPSQEELRRAFIFPSSGPPKMFRDLGIHKEAWSSSFASGAPKGFVFCPRGLSPYVFLATETIVARRFEVPVPDWMVEESKQSAETIRELKLQLRQKSYYSDKAAFIRPLREHLVSADVQNIVAEFARRFASAQESVADVQENKGLDSGVEVMQRRALAWLDQFSTDQSIDCALELLRHARLLERKDTVAALQAFLGRHPEFGNASVVSLSKGAESSQIVQYYAADISSGLSFYPSLHDAARENREGPVIFIDDVCGSGGQVINILGSWFDDPRLKRDLKEPRLAALEPEKDYLADRKVAFVFVAGWKDGLDQIRAATRDLGIDAEVFAHLLDADLPFGLEPPLGSEIREEIWTSFLEECRDIGDQLLQPENWPQEKRQERALGYGNRAMLFFSAYNAPSQTLTCMWAEGVVNGAAWKPIMRRRKKL
jgi:HD superfamily phosphohydrolase